MISIGSHIEIEISVLCLPLINGVLLQILCLSFSVASLGPWHFFVEQDVWDATSVVILNCDKDVWITIGVDVSDVDSGQEIILVS